MRPASGSAERRSGCIRTARRSGDQRCGPSSPSSFDDPRVVAIGECGLDFYRDRASREAQARAFEGQAELALEAGKALVIHSREAAAETLEVLRGFSGRVVLHCFALPDDLDEVLAARLVGELRRQRDVPERAWRCRRRRGAFPAERLLVETDSPYLAPVPHRGRPCRPAMVLDTLRFVAALRGEDPEALGAAVVESATRRSPRRSDARAAAADAAPARRPRGAAEPRARPALPAGRQPARRDRPARRPARRRRGARGRRWRRDADRPPGRRGSRTSSRSRSTGAWSRRSQRCSRRTRTWT